MTSCLRVILFALALTVAAGAFYAAVAEEATLLCRFSKFTVTESVANQSRLKTMREVKLAIPRSILVSYDAERGAVSSPQQNMHLAEARFESGQVAAHISHVSDNSWIFGEEIDGDAVLIVDTESHIGSMMAQLKSAGQPRLAVSAGDCRQFRMQAQEPPASKLSMSVPAAN